MPLVSDRANAEAILRWEHSALSTSEEVPLGRDQVVLGCTRSTKSQRWERSDRVVFGLRWERSDRVLPGVATERPPNSF
jgi:hypothetical protein